VFLCITNRCTTTDTKHVTTKFSTNSRHFLARCFASLRALEFSIDQ
jgi:hypothetical protein